MVSTLGSPLAVTIHPRAIASWSDIQGSKDLQSTIEASHLYMVVVRPTVKASVDVEGLEVYSDEFGDAPSYRCKAPFSGFDLFNHGKKLRDQTDGSWCYAHDAAAEILYGAASDGLIDLDHYLRLLSWRICYIGMSYGSGYGSLTSRLSQHKTILQIMDDYSGLPFDIRIIPITCEQSGLFLGMTGMSSPLPNAGLVQKFVSDDGVLESADLVSAIENLLITYFQPSYNKNLKEWPATKSSKLLQTLDVDSLIVDFDGAEDTFALVTERRAEPERGFALAAEVFGAQRIWNLAYPSGLGYDFSVDYDPRNPVSLLAAVVSGYCTSKPQAAFRENATV